jgi:hypothetical protein
MDIDLNWGRKKNRKNKIKTLTFSCVHGDNFF